MDIVGVGVTETSLAVAVTTAPLVEAVELLAVVAGLDVLSEILAIKSLVHAHSHLPRPGRIILENGSLVNLLGRHSLELGRGQAQHHPVLLEDTKVGGVTALAVSY